MGELWCELTTRAAGVRAVNSRLRVLASSPRRFVCVIGHLMEISCSVPIQPRYDGLKLMDLRPQHRAARAVRVDPLGKGREIVGDENVAQIVQPLARALAIGGNGLGIERRPVAVLEGERGFLDQPEQ